ncbi:MAG: hypothetical protein MI673_08900 [Thiotrichales bacterium]|nr:hypothetical protein [Thiotrichales bacterium]
MASVLAGPIGLPESARPGAVRPDSDLQPTLPPQPAAEVLEIPAVIDRPFDIDEGEIVVVNRFRLLNAEDLPDFDVTVVAVEQLLEELRAGRPDGFTIGRLQEVADEVTRYYRQKGLILAQAVVPVQNVEEGVVDIQVFEGRLGRILVEANEMYSEEILRRPFENLVGQPITKGKVEAALLTLTDYPGLSVFGVFQPGLKVGTADIVLKVQEEKFYDIALRVDNHGTQETGRARFRTTIDWNNALSSSDRLTMTVQQSYRPKENVFKSLQYERHFGTSWLFGGFWDANKFDVAGEFKEQQISAETENAGIWLRKSFLRSRLENFSAEVGLTRKESISKRAAAKRSRDILGVLSLKFDYDSVDTFDLMPAMHDEEFRAGGINFAQLEILRGFNEFMGSMGSSGKASTLVTGFRPSRQGGSRKFAEGQFLKVFATASRLQTLRPNHSLLMRGELQWSDDLLVPMEQYSIGGAENVRAFPPAIALFDRAYFMSFEYIINAPFIADVPAFGTRTWGEVLQLSLFYDHALGRLNDPGRTEEQSYESYRGAGFQFRFNIPGMIDSRLMWAWAVGAENSSDTGNDRRPQIWGDLTYSF